MSSALGLTACLGSNFKAGRLVFGLLLVCGLITPTVFAQQKSKKDAIKDKLKQAHLKLPILPSMGGDTNKPQSPTTTNTSAAGFVPQPNQTQTGNHKPGAPDVKKKAPWWQITAPKDNQNRKPGGFGQGNDLSGIDPSQNGPAAPPSMVALPGADVFGDVRPNTKTTGAATTAGAKGMTKGFGTFQGFQGFGGPQSAEILALRRRRSVASTGARGLSRYRALGSSKIAERLLANKMRRGAEEPARGIFLTGIKSGLYPRGESKGLFPTAAQGSGLFPATHAAEDQKAVKKKGLGSSTTN